MMITSNRPVQFNTPGTRLFALISFILAFVIVYYFNQQPGYTDSFYHYNAAVHVSAGDGFVDDYLWVYIGASGELPAPSHLYWMPGTTLVASLGMFFFGGNYSAARIGLALCLWGASFVAYYLGLRIGTNSRIAWQAGLIVLFSGFFMRFWGQTDTFAPYAFVGSMALLSISVAATSEGSSLRWWGIAGIFAALGHLVRSDGLLLLLVGWAVIFFPFDFFTEAKRPFPERLRCFFLFTAAYIVVMSPWFLRNLSVIGTPLPIGGMQGAWFTGYNDLFNYPPDASPATLFADGWNLFVQTRIWALFSKQGAIINFIAVESIIVLTPFILIALWVRRKERFLRSVWIFALGVHLAFSIVFPFPGVRGGLFHAVAALMPFWAVLGLLGLDDSVDWMARKRHRWNPKTAKPIFSMGITLLIIFLSLSISLPARFKTRQTDFYSTLASSLPDDTRVMINDPAQLYYYTGLGGVVVPNESPDVALEIARVYEIDYLVLESDGITDPMRFSSPPDYFILLDTEFRGALYAINRD